MRKIYIAGPMSGIPEWNYPAFFAAEDSLRKEGWTDIKNPARKDEDMGYDDQEAKVSGDTALAVAKGVFDFRTAYLWDIEQVVTGDAIYMLPGWENSPGARGEWAAAVFAQKNNPDYKIIYANGEKSGD